MAQTRLNIVWLTDEQYKELQAQRKAKKTSSAQQR
jgi:hypothetical protein